MGFYEIISDTHGKRLEGQNPAKANSAFHTYARFAAAGETVTLYRDGQPVKSHTATNSDRRN